MRICEWLWRFYLALSVGMAMVWVERLTCVCVGRKVYVSFGGLLLFLEGPYKNLTPLRIDYVYLCMKK